MVKVFRYAGFAEESEHAEDPSPAAQFHVDIASAGLDAPADTQLTYAGGLTRGARVHRPGAYAPEGDVVYALDINTIGWFLKWALGGYVYTEGTAPDPNVHEIYASNEQLLPTFCTRIGKDIFEHVFAGCAVNSLELTAENEFVTATLDVAASKDAKAALQALDDLLLPDEFPLAFHEVTLSRDSSDVSARVRAWTVTITNNADAEAGQGAGSRHPYRIPVGEREVTLEMTLYFDDTAELERFWGGSTGPAVTGAEEFGVVVNFNAGADGELDIAAPRVIYTGVPQAVSGRDAITQEVSIKAYETTHTLADGTTEVHSELLATLQNGADEMVAAP